MPLTTRPSPSSWTNRWIKTECGRAKYAELAGRTGVWARPRLAWFVVIAALRDWSLPQPADTGMDATDRP